MSKSTITQIIFDFDGTISNTLPVWVDGFVHTFEKFGLRYSAEQIMQECIGVRGGAVNLGIKETELDDFYKNLNSEVRANLFESPVFAGCEAALKFLQAAGYRLSILTSSAKESTTQYLVKHSLNSYFDVVVGSLDVKNLKPDPEGIFKVMNYYNNLNKQEYLIVGDSSKDILAGKNAGIKTALFVPKKSSLSQNRVKINELNADYVFNSWKEFNVDSI